MSEGATLIGNRFTIGSIIGAGGMATVYEGTDTLTDEKVAIKLLKHEVIVQDPDIVARFDREGEALRRLNHPNIVKMLATVIEADKHYVVMEHVGGGDLNDLIRSHRQENKPIPIARILEIALDLSDALTRAHRLKIVHRDIKPANVLIAEDGTPRLTDFGVAHFSDSTQMTKTGSLIGTLAYLSPEACGGEKTDTRTDIWAFGVMLYELLTLQRPFEENNSAALIIAIMSKFPPDITEIRPDAPLSLVVLIQQMMAKDPNDRIGSARLVGAQLENIISRGDITDMPLDNFEAKLSKMAGFSDSTPSSMRLNTYQVPPSVDHGEFIPDSAIKTNPIATNTIAPPTTLAQPKKGVNVAVLIGGFISLIALVILGLVIVSNGNNTPITPTNTDTSPTLLDPVDPKHLMVIVGGFDNIGGESRDVGRAIYEDLRNKLERDVPFSRIQVRLYPEVIRTSDHANQIAEANEAAIVVWGRYDEAGVNIQLQIGSIKPFTRFVVTREEASRITDIELVVTDERRESVVLNILAIINVLYTYNNDVYEVGRNLAILELLNTGTHAQVVGNSIAALWHRYFRVYNSAEEVALTEINRAISLNSNVILLYMARALSYARLARYDDMFQDIDTVRSLDTAGIYLGDDVLLAQYYFWFGEQEDLDETLRILEPVVEQIPDEWWTNTILGLVYWLKGDLDTAQTTLEHAVSQSPDANYPYIGLISIYLRQGELVKAGEMIKIVREQFPDTTIANRIINSTFKLDGVPLTYLTEISGYFVLGQWNSVVDVLSRVEFSDAYSEVYLLGGLAYCNLKEFDQAEASYTRVIEKHPDYYLAYMLRAETRLKNNNAGGALADVAVILQSDQAEQFAPFIPYAQSGEISCETILEVDFSTFTS